MAILQVPVTKAGTTIPVDMEPLTEEAYKYILLEGLKAIANKRMANVKTKDLEGAELSKAKDVALGIAKENIQNVIDGKVKTKSAAATTADGKKVPGVVMTRARNDAKAVVKNEIRNAGGKISHYEASEITAAANELLRLDAEAVAAGTTAYADSYIGKAEAAIALLSAKNTVAPIEVAATASDEEKAAAEAAKAKAKADLEAKLGLKESPKLIAANEAKKAKAKQDRVLSATQAGKPKAAPRKGSKPAQATA